MTIFIQFFIAAYFSEIVGTIAGFGSSTIFLPLALLFVDFKTALILVALMHIFGNIGRISFFHQGLDKRTLLNFGIPSVLATLIGAFLVSLISQEFLKGLLGIFLILYSGFSLINKYLHLKPSLQNSIIGGGFSGFFAGLIGTGGALRGAFLTAFNLPKDKYIATAAAIAIAVDITRVPVYFANGFLSSKYYWYLPLLFVIALAGSFTGRKIVKRISQEKFKKIVLFALFLSGLKFFYDWIILG